MGIPLGTSSFTSSFIKDAMLENVRHVDFFLKMGDVQVAFGIITHCFMQWLSYLLHYTPPSSTFIEPFISFHSSLFQMFGSFLGPRSFDNLEGPLACKQVLFPIFFYGIRLMLMTIIAPTTYLGNWAFVALIKVVRFMVDQLRFLLKALTQVDNNTFPF